MRYYYTEKEFKELCKDIEILHDTREQENSHILDWFDKKNVKHSERALKVGDYTLRISPKSSDRHACAWFDDEIFIERKNSLDELVNSLKEKRFHRELKEASLIKYKFLLIENTQGYEDILNHNYRSEYNPKAFYNTLNTLQMRYILHIEFVPNPALMGQRIWSICKSVLKEHLKTD